MRFGVTVMSEGRLLMEGYGKDREPKAAFSGDSGFCLAKHVCVLGDDGRKIQHKSPTSFQYVVREISPRP